MKNNLSEIRSRITHEDADALLLTHMPDVRWACGFTGSNAALIVLRGNASHFLTDGRYEGQAHREVQGAQVHVPGYNLFEHADEKGLFGNAKRVLFQAAHTSVAQWEKWRERFEDITWLPATDLMEPLVASKTTDEIDKIHAAQRVTDIVFEHIISFIAPGMSEQEVGAEIVYQHLRRGASTMAFDPIVAAGPNGALPHARPTRRVIERGDLVVIDMGCFVDGYASDMTRTVAVGEPPAEARAVYDLVRRAQEAALDAAHAGMTGTALDRVARDVIEDGGHGEHFPHSLGHGIGLQTHEWPRLSRHVEHTLPEGATVTIEPGVYVPEKGFGVRIEDIVALRAGGCDNLTASPKELLVL